ncbi:MAG TPA: ribonuclease H-like domain-containing protein [Candidatus Paceibacterota bacterium]|nr:ribonuclease H-like domain-containing protein [Candidatus Paceibacterota bacterium]
MKKIVFDIETRNIFQDVGSNDPRDLDISVVCLYDYETDAYHSFLQEEFGKLWPILEKADMLITYNGDHFDIPLLDKYYPGDLTRIKSLDLLKEVKNSLGFRLKLDSIAQATLGTGKSGHGLEAVTWWKQGEVDKIIKYCKDDVKVTKDIYDYAMKHGHLKFKDGPHVKEIKLNTKDWETKSEAAMTFTLGF